MSAPVVYHGTPMTPRDALLSVCAGRAMCVSFYRPDDVEAVEAIAPAIMFRQRRVLVLAAGSTCRDGMGRASRLGAILQLARTATVSTWPVGSDPGQPGCPLPAQRRAPEGVAVRTEGRAPVAHGWADRAAVAAVRSIRPAVRSIRPGVSRVDRAEGWLARLSRADGRGFQGAREQVAGHSHDARCGGGVRLPVRQRGLDLSRTERLAI
jgi:hypothetical protein